MGSSRVWVPWGSHYEILKLYNNMPKRKATSVMMSQTYPGRTKKAKFNRKTYYPVRVPRDITNLNVTGKVSAASTDLALNKSPFPPVKYTNFIYENELTVMSGATNVLVKNVVYNDLYDFDRNGDFGNKQPLYFDTLLSGSGPYKNYKVISWITTWTICNMTTGTPITVWTIPPNATSSDIDSVAEADNFPGVKRLFLTGREGSKSMGTITTRGHIKDLFATYMDDVSLIASYNTSPTSAAYGGLIVKGSDGSTAPSVYVAVKHVAYAELTAIDALVS